MEFEGFVEREYPRLVGALSLYCGDRGVAEELAHEALIRAHERWAEVQQMAAPGAWTHRVATNLASSYFRRRTAERRAVDRMAGDRPVERPVEVASSVTVRRAIAGLPERLREVVVLRFFYGFSVEETAAQMGITGGSVKAYTHRAVLKLREELGVDLPEPEASTDSGEQDGTEGEMRDVR